jgi:Na+-translocating ferredoxin:NAD+ oxidoreductase subunit B
MHPQAEAGSLAARVEAIERQLPQTQCRQCGFDGCTPYAVALARGEADIDRCPPGGDAGARALARVLQRPVKPYDRQRGLHKPPQVAWVREADCIGCTKCIQACPVDAIVGASKFMHTVIADLCTGCELCLPPCPVDCIELRPAAD